MLNSKTGSCYRLRRQRESRRAIKDSAEHSSHAKTPTTEGDAEEPVVISDFRVRGAAPSALHWTAS